MFFAEEVNGKAANFKSLTALSERYKPQITQISNFAERFLMPSRELSVKTNACSIDIGLSTIGGEIRRRAELQPDHTAVVASGLAPLSYRELQCLIDNVRTALRLAGFGRNARIAIAMRNGPQAALAIVAVACSAVSIPLNPRQSLSEIETCLGAIQPDAVIIVEGADSAARRVAERKGIVIIEANPTKKGSLGFGLAAPKTEIAVSDESDDPAPDAPAFVLQTSGTTSVPKLVPRSHRNMLAAAEMFRVWFHLQPQDRCLCVSPVYHGQGLVVTVFTPLLTGGTMVFPADALKFDYDEWFGSPKSTWYTGSPALHRMILDHTQSRGDAKTGHSLRFILSGGALLPSDLREGLEHALGIPLLDHYGFSEAAQIATNLPPPGPSKPGTCGIPWPDTVIIVGEDGKNLQSGELGEVLVRGPTVMSGYLNAPEQNRTRFVNGWFKTGDMGRLDDDGFLTLHGRKDDLINRGGEKISPVEIDDALTRHPAIAEAAAFAVPHPRLGEDVAAAVVLRPGMTATPSELRAYLEERLASFKVPRRIVIRDQLPKGDIGKVVRRRLAEGPDEGASGGTPVPQLIQGMSLDETLVAQLREIWERLLKISSVALDDDFFESGGDSLLAMEMLVELERLAGRKIPTPILFDFPTIRQLAQKLSDSNYLDRKPSILTRLNSRGNQTPLLYFHGDFEDGGYYAVRLARLLGPDQPVMIVAPHGVGDEPIPSSIEAMAADRLLLIRNAQPRGPYRLCGYCNGGVVAFEVARRLIATGEQVEMIGMIDPPPVNAPSSRVQRLSVRLQSFLNLPPARQWAGIKRKLENLVARSDERAPFEKFTAKLSNYFPKPIRARVLYFSVEYGAETWRRLSPDFEIIKLTGDHLGVLSDPSDLAQHLRARLRPSK